MMSAEKNPSEPSNSRASTPTGPAILVSCILNALENVKQGKTKDYDMLIQKLADPDIKEIHLQRYLIALTNCSSCLTKQYDTLVGTALNTRWALCGEKTVDEFIEFLTSLVSAQTFYLRACLRMIIKLFLPGISKDAHLKTADSEDFDKMFLNAHEALKAVLEVVPAVSQFLIPVLSENFPYMKKPTIFQASYVKNLLEITKYLPNLRTKILELIIHNLIKIDVEIPKHELEHNEAAIEEKDEEEEDHTQFEVDMEAAPTVSLVEDNCMDNEMADKLDILMDILFNYINEVTHLNEEHIIDAGTELFNELLVVFENVILPTHASCHVQFVMFRLCSFDLEFANSFLDLCWRKFEDLNTPAILRQACAAYIASLIARAKYIPISTVQTCLDLVAHWIHCYIDINDAGCVGPDVSKYGPFYSVCQALFYIFIFRHKQLLDIEKGLNYIRRLNLDRIVTCRLNPLKVCLPTVVKMFAHITRHHELVFCYTIIERNNRMLLPVARPTSSRAVMNLSFMNQLDSFFPYDPYLLRRSAKFIKPIYQEWEGLEHDEEHDEDEKKHSDAEDETEDYLEYSRSPDATVPGFTPDTPMCVSPGFVSSPIRQTTVLLNDLHRSRR